jgi:hypothetical protein
MKRRNGFVSNSSSSSFILRKSALTKEQTQEIKALFRQHKDKGETSIAEDDEFYRGDLEAHNAISDQCAPLHVLFADLMNNHGLAIGEDWDIEYCGNVFSFPGEPGHNEY